MGRCLSPCDGSVAAGDYLGTVEDLRRSLWASPTVVTTAIRARMAKLADGERFEEAASHRNRMATFVRAAARSQRLRALTACSEVVRARRNDLGRWEVHVVRYGRLAAAGVIPDRHERPRLDRPSSGDGRDRHPPPRPRPGRHGGGVREDPALARAAAHRLVHIEGVWSCPVGGAESQRELIDSIDGFRESLVPFDQPRLSSTLSRPVR